VLVVGLAHAASAQQAKETQTRNTSFEVTPRGYIQLDWRGFPDWTVEPDTGRLERDVFEVRRLRFGVDGRWRRVTYEVSIDPQDGDGVYVKDAYGQIRLPAGLRLRVGQFKLPGSYEYGEAARSLDFMERSSLAASAAAGRDIGGMVTGALGRRVEYQGGLFAGDGNGRPSRAGLTSAGRLAWDGPKDWEAAGWFTEGATSGVDAEPPNGLDGRSTAGYRFFERLYVSGRRLRVGGDAAWTPGPWRLGVEALRVRDDRSQQGLDLEDLPSLAGFGWSATITRELGRRRGQARSRLREVDLGLRFDTLTFDDTGADTGRDSVRPRATDVRRRGVETLTAGVTWRLTSFARILTNAAVERYSEPRSAPEPGRTGPYFTAGARLQLELP
jgi:phosphate-selective porin